MPDCINCSYLNAGTQTCISKGKDESHVRGCVNAIIKKIFNTHNLENKKVLEVGCGKNRTFRKIAKQNGAEWYGLEPRSSSGSTNKGKAEEAKSIFPQNSFDLIYAGQTVEHWKTQKTITNSIRKLRSILKPNCWMCINVPIFSHGVTMFKYYNEKEILNCFKDLHSNKWQNIELEKWRYNYEPLPPYNVKRRITSKVAKISTQKEPSVWILEINLQK